MERVYKKARRKDFNIEYDVRKMTSDEIDTSDSEYYCSDETGHIFKESELIFIS